MWKLLWWMLAQPQFGAHFVDCGCLCVEGVPKTVCQSLAEAQQQANVCAPNIRCPALPEEGGATDEPQYYDAPDPHAHSCREVRIWDESAAAYTGVKICDVFTG